MGCLMQSVVSSLLVVGAATGWRVEVTAPEYETSAVAIVTIGAAAAAAGDDGAVEVAAAGADVGAGAGAGAGKVTSGMLMSVVALFGVPSSVHAVARKTAARTKSFGAVERLVVGDH